MSKKLIDLLSYIPEELRNSNFRQIPIRHLAESVKAQSDILKFEHEYGRSINLASNYIEKFLEEDTSNKIVITPDTMIVLEGDEQDVFGYSLIDQDKRINRHQVFYGLGEKHKMIDILRSVEIDYFFLNTNYFIDQVGPKHL